MKRSTLALALTVLVALPATALANPIAVPTFESLGIYWNHSKASASRAGNVRYREKGTSSWKTARPLWFDNSVPDRQGGKYRGSVVHLKPGTSYDVELKIAGTTAKSVFTAKTWSDTFPVARTVMLPESSSQTLSITESGTATGYVLFTGPPGAVIDTQGVGDCITVNASYVIIRGLNLRNCETNGITILGGKDIVIEENDISGWGRIAEDGWGVNFDAAVSSESTTLEKVIVQRNKMHHPRSDSNSWDEPRPLLSAEVHPYGPHAIAFRNSAGNHVFRYNEVYSDPDHMFNDIFGRDMNESTAGESPVIGFPNRDTDVYGNYIRDFYDDAFELEGDNRNIRVWGNYFQNGRCAVGTAPTIVGPFYMWRNVTVDVDRLFKGGRAQWGSELRMVVHNTTVRGASREFTIYNPMIALNNVLQSTTAKTISGSRVAPTLINYDLYNGTVPSGTEGNGKKNVPIYATAAQLDSDTLTGNFSLASNSLGYNHGTVVANFTGVYSGTAPDMGAHEAGRPAMEFGVNAHRGGGIWKALALAESDPGLRLADDPSSLLDEAAETDETIDPVVGCSIGAGRGSGAGLALAVFALALALTMTFRRVVRRRS